MFCNLGQAIVRTMVPYLDRCHAFSSSIFRIDRNHQAQPQRDDAPQLRMISIASGIGNA